MDTIYITGHKNPDTDSIISAMAYAALKNALGLREYKAARLGEISDETRTVLERFHAEPPMRLNDVRTQVRDLDYDTPTALSPAAMPTPYRKKITPQPAPQGDFFIRIIAPPAPAASSVRPRCRCCRSAAAPVRP